MFHGILHKCSSAVYGLGGVLTKKDGLVNKVLRCPLGRQQGFTQSRVSSWRNTATMTVKGREVSWLRCSAPLFWKRRSDGPVIPPVWVSRILVARW
jgi:hypothetical protein